MKKKDTFRSNWGSPTVFACDACGRSTRHTNQGNDGLCPECDERTMTENGLSDDSKYYAERPAEKAEQEAKILKLALEAVKKGGDRERLGLERLGLA